MQIKAHLSNARMSPRKIRQLTGVVVKQPADEVLSQLTFQRSHAADIVLKLIRSAVANAKNNFSIESKNLRIQSFMVGDGLKFKRFQPVSRGSAHGYVKRNAHITVVLEEITPGEPSSRRPKATEIETLSIEELSGGTGEPVVEKVLEKAQEAPPVTGAYIDPKMEAFQKIKMQQQGGDQKKTHRRKSM